MQVIGCCGFANAGKSTAAQYFVEHHQFTRLSFAHPVKDITALLFGWDRTRLEGASAEDRAWREEEDPFWSRVLERPFSPRVGLQFVGTDLVRDHVHPDMWALSVVAKIRQMGSSARVIIDDVRFVNELAVLRSIGAHIMVIDRGFPSFEHRQLWLRGEDHVKTGTFFEGDVTLHRSEWDWLRDPLIFTASRVVNTGEVPAFHRALELWYTDSRLNSLYHEDVLV